MSMIKCKGCGSEFSSLAIECPKCGRKRMRKGMKVGLISGTVILFLILAAILPKSKPVEQSQKQVITEPIKPDTPETRDPATVFYASKMFMEKELKDPKSAKWPEYGDDGVKVGFSQKTGLWVIASFVDSRNSYNGMIRTLYVMTIEYLPGQGYKMASLDTQP